MISPDILLRFKYLLPILGVSIVLIELGYVFFIWMKKTRFIWLVCIVGMHIGIGLTMGMYLFALIMVVLNLAAFGPDPGVLFLRLRQRFRAISGKTALAVTSSSAAADMTM